MEAEVFVGDVDVIDAVVDGGGDGGIVVADIDDEVRLIANYKPYTVSDIKALAISNNISVKGVKKKIGYIRKLVEHSRANPEFNPLEELAAARERAKVEYEERWAQRERDFAALAEQRRDIAENMRNVQENAFAQLAAIAKRNEEINDTKEKGKVGFDKMANVLKMVHEKNVKNINDLYDLDSLDDQGKILIKKIKKGFAVQEILTKKCFELAVLMKGLHVDCEFPYEVDNEEALQEK